MYKFYDIQYGVAISDGKWNKYWMNSLPGESLEEAIERGASAIEKLFKGVENVWYIQHETTSD